MEERPVAWYVVASVTVWVEEVVGYIETLSNRAALTGDLCRTRAQWLLAPPSPEISQEPPCDSSLVLSAFGCSAVVTAELALRQGAD